MVSDVLSSGLNYTGFPFTYTNSNLTDHDTNDLKVGDSGDPVHRALAIVRLAAPARLPAIGGGEVAAQVTDGEQDVALEAEAGAGQDGVVPVPAQGTEGVLLHHGADLGQLLLGLGIVDRGDELDALGQGQVGPVDALWRVAVVRVCDVVEDLALLVGGDAGVWRVGVCLITGLWPVGHGDLPR